ncbi:DUF2752 domain-containing protein [Rhodococcus sp. (in: high G+C Gram-positive bacteria)]|uniref:DUF2752 domain-containing protein n=1 Tax=Rhodococcus sp. TaxID=1831 RepID=UPI003BB132AC
MSRESKIVNTGVVATQKKPSTSSVSGLRALRAPAAVAAGALVAATILHFRDPYQQGAYGFCPVYAMTGLWCPGCGGLRAVHDLTNMDLGSAVSSNVLILPLLAVLTFAWIRWVRRRRHDRPPSALALGPRATVFVLIVLAAFTVTRNTTWGSWLAPA